MRKLARRRHPTVSGEDAVAAGSHSDRLKTASKAWPAVDLLPASSHPSGAFGRLCRRRGIPSAGLPPERPSSGFGAGVDDGSASPIAFAALKAREAKLGVIGLGYVGLPLSLTAAIAGFRVLGFDINETARRHAQQRRGCFQAYPSSNPTGGDRRGALRSDGGFWAPERAGCHPDLRADTA